MVELQPDSNSLWGTDKLMQIQLLEHGALEVLGYSADAGVEQPAALLPQPGLSRRNITDNA